MKKIVSILLLLTPIFAYSQSGRIKPVPSESIINQLIADSLTDVKIRGVYQCENYGASTSEANNTPFIQATIDSASANGGGIVTLLTPGVYTVASSGSSCYTYETCINLKDSIDLVLGVGVTLKLADNQWSDIGPVKVKVISACDISNFSVSGGKIDGNASGQTTWTGGYEQATAALLNTKDCSFFRIESIKLVNCLSNAFDFFTSYNGYVNNIYSSKNGEGPEFVGCTDFNVSNIIVNDSTNVHVGDAFELSVCRRFAIDNLVITENGAGSAVDLYGSYDVTVNNLVVDGWNSGFSYSAPTDSTAKNITLTNAVFRNISGDGVLAGGLGYAKISECLFDNVKRGVNFSDSDRLYTVINDCVFTNCTAGIVAEANDTIIIRNSLFQGNTSGIRIDVDNQGFDSTTVVSVGNTFIENTYAILFAGDGITTIYPNVFLNSDVMLRNTNNIGYTSIAPNNTDGWVTGQWMQDGEYVANGFVRGVEETNFGFFVEGQTPGLPIDLLQTDANDYVVMAQSNSAGLRLGGIGGPGVLRLGTTNQILPYTSTGLLNLGVSSYTAQVQIFSPNDDFIFLKNATYGNGFRIHGGTEFALSRNGTPNRAFRMAQNYATNAIYIGSNGVAFQNSTTNTAKIHIGAGTAAASTAPLKFTAGTNLTTPENGAIEFDGTNYFATALTTRYTIAKTLTATASLDFGSTSAQSSADLTITVTGAASGDSVQIGVPNGSVNANSSFSGWVSAPNTVTIRFNNYSSSPIDPASGTFRATVTKY